MREQLRNRRRTDAHAHVVGAAREHDRHPGAEHQPGTRGTGQVLQLFGHHVAGFEVRHHQDVGIAGARGLIINISASEESFTLAEFMEAVRCSSKARSSDSISSMRRRMPSTLALRL